MQHTQSMQPIQLKMSDGWILEGKRERERKKGKEEEEKKKVKGYRKKTQELDFNQLKMSC